MIFLAQTIATLLRENHKELHQLFLLDLLHCISVFDCKKPINDPLK